MGGIAELDFKLQWSDGQCQLQDDAGLPVEVVVRGGCPMVPYEVGIGILQRLEELHLRQALKMQMVKTIAMNPQAVASVDVNLEVALTVKMREIFPGLPDHTLGKLIPATTSMDLSSFGSKVPWNRHKRRRIARAKNVVLHVFAGEHPQWWEQQLSTSTTEVLCVDITGSGVVANLLDPNVFGVRHGNCRFWQTPWSLRWASMSQCFCTSLCR